MLCQKCGNKQAVMKIYENINNEKKTTGFMVDGSYVKYYDALQNIDLIDNLAVTEDGVIRSTDKTLDKIDVSKVNK